jgi:hypothetical protein
VGWGQAGAAPRCGVVWCGVVSTSYDDVSPWPMRSPSQPPRARAHRLDVLHRLRHCLSATADARDLVLLRRRRRRLLRPPPPPLPWRPCPAAVGTAAAHRAEVHLRSRRLHERLDGRALQHMAYGRWHMRGWAGTPRHGRRREARTPWYGRGVDCQSVSRGTASIAAAAAQYHTVCRRRHCVQRTAHLLGPQD